ncbi:MAG: AbrB/MazE/SpoVT family DNA-binding domain-containing protein [Deltaproteobacteria bacterium]|nr:AbrB/MazE/SpoVT family DNA-binding domain-containing protein [Deltaproteobacteria bacterium]
MAKINSKGQITVPQEIRNKFGFLPGMDEEVITEGNKTFIVKSRHENRFMKWYGRGKKQNKHGIDLMVDQARGRTDG